MKPHPLSALTFSSWKTYDEIRTLLKEWTEKVNPPVY